MEEKIIKIVSTESRTPGRALTYYHSNAKWNPASLEFKTQELANEYEGIVTDIMTHWVRTESKIQMKRGLLVGTVLTGALFVGGVIGTKVYKRRKNKLSEKDI